MNYYMNAIGTTLAIVLGILLVCLLIPAQQAAAPLTVTQDGAIAAIDSDTLIVALEYAVDADEDEIRFVVSYGIMTGELWYFEPGDIVYPTGMVAHHAASDGSFKIIEVTSRITGGKWWMYEAQTR